MSDRHKRFGLAQYDDFTGIISDWAVISVMKDNRKMVDRRHGVPYTYLLGGIDIDFRGRFKHGTRLRSSPVKKFDDHNFVATTINSCYLLSGSGIKMAADFSVINLIMCSGLRVSRLIELFPGCMEYTHMEACSWSVH